MSYILYIGRLNRNPFTRVIASKVGLEYRICNTKDDAIYHSNDAIGVVFVGIQKGVLYDSDSYKSYFSFIRDLREIIKVKKIAAVVDQIDNKIYSLPRKNYGIDLILAAKIREKLDPEIPEKLKNLFIS